MKKIVLASLCCAVALMARPVAAQQALDETVTSIRYDFSGFTGAGFSPTPDAGQLDSNEWIATGASDPSFDFGGTAIGGDYARGMSPGGVTTGGVYAFDHGANPSLGVQPGGDDFTPGTLQLRVRNSTGEALSVIELSYTFLYRNDGGRSIQHTVRVVRESDGAEIAVPDLDMMTPLAAAEEPSWVSEVRTATIDLSTVAIPEDENLIVVFALDDVAGGSGSRDEIALDDVVVARTGCGNGVVGGEEVCDDGNVLTETMCPYGMATCMACNSDCSMSLSLTGPFCGDGHPDVEHGETCDDGNTDAGDGCDATCAEEVIADAGTVDSDGGFADGGVDVDAGDVDAGDVLDDAGIDVDAGEQEVDAGSPPRDAGNDVEEDASTTADSGMRRGPAVAGGGCSCRAAGAPGQSGVGALALIGLLGLVIVRRQRRQS